MYLYVLAFLIGVVAGLRSMVAPAIVCWGARLGYVTLETTPLAFLASRMAVFPFTLFALGELLADKLPKTPSRKSPIGFGARIVTGALCGAALGAAREMLVPGLIAGIAGAVVGMFAGYEVRTRLAKAIGKDLPVALLEDAIAIGGACAIVSQF